MDNKISFYQPGEEPGFFVLRASAFFMPCSISPIDRLPKFRYNTHMKLKEFIKERNITTKALSERTGLPYSTTNDIVNGIVSVDNVGLGKCKAIADCLEITLDEFYDLYNNVIKIADDAEVVVKNHGYYFQFEDTEKYICKASEYNASVIKEIATWEYEDIIEEREFQEWARKKMTAITGKEEDGDSNNRQGG